MKFERGYKIAREKTAKGSKFIRSCMNCVHFGRSGNSKHDKCLNNEVSQYDIIVEGNNVYCTLWTPYTKGLKDNSLFGKNRGGRSILERLENESM